MFDKKITSIVLTFTCGAFYFASSNMSSSINEPKVEINKNTSTTNSKTTINVKFPAWSNFHLIESGEKPNSQDVLILARELMSENKKPNNSNLQEIQRLTITAKRVPAESKLKANIRKKILVSKSQRIAIEKAKDTNDPIRSATMVENDKKKSSLLLQPIENVISSSFGKRIDPIGNTVKFHKGIDISRPPGTEVFAWSEGVISRSGWLSGYGLTVDVTHVNGIKTRYAHLMLANVQKGQKIAKGQTVGRVGETGRTTGPNLHFEVAVAGKITDPQDHLSRITEIVGDDIGAIDNG